MTYEHEKRGGKVQGSRLLEGFSEAITDSELQDLGYLGNEFTWERSRGSPTWIQERLDRGLANQDWRAMFPAATVTVLEASTSDHLPILLELKRKLYVPKTHRFHFENMWIKEEQCRQLVQKGWQVTGGRTILEKMEYVCMKLDEWGGGKLKEMRCKIQEYRREMKKFRSRRDIYGVGKYNEARWEYMKLLEQKEVYWKQRAKQFWLKDGDQNTRFFRNFALGRKKNNQLVRLQDKHGDWKEDREDIQHIVMEYFEDLFQASTTAGELTDREKVNQVTDVQNRELEKPITCEEVKNAVFAMYHDKSPGYDGLNPGFYQAYWDIIGEDVVKFCQVYFEIGELPEGVNRTLVCSIPKIKQPQKMKR